MKSRGRGAALLALCCLQGAVAHAEGAASAPDGGKSGIEADDAREAREAAEEEIVVTGRLPHGAVATDVKPEVRINAAVIESLGANDLNEVFEDLAPELNTGGSGAGGLSTPPIVLVNGQRIAGFSSIKDVPPEAVRNIEVFPEKVALQYGYGPDQRVVNVILRTNYRALTLTARDTLAPETWRGIYEGKVDLLRIGEDSHWNIDIDYHHEDPLFSTSTIGAPVPAGQTAPAVPPFTTGDEEDHLKISGLWNRKFGSVTAELAGFVQLDGQQNRYGLAAEDGALLTQQGLANLITGPTGRADRNVSAETSLALNGLLDTWHWAFIGKLDASNRVTRTSQALLADGLAPVLLPSPGVLVENCGAEVADGCVSTRRHQATGDLYLNGDFLRLPAGAATAAIRAGFVFTGIKAESALDLADVERRKRNEGNIQVNLDFPLTAHDSPIGKLSVGVNGEVRQLSDFGTLPTIGSTLDWSPVRPVEIIASYSRVEDAPDPAQLGAAILATPQLRVYDFANASSSIVDRIEGGNPDLQHETSDITKIRLQLTPIRGKDLALSAEYTLARNRNPVVDLTAPTAAIMAAFPDNFALTNGFLTGFDVRPVNLARRDQQQLRWGVNYSTPFGRSWRSVGSRDPASPMMRNQFQIALYHTWRFQDDVLLRQGQPTLDLLSHDILSDQGGTSRHQIELQTSLATRPWSLDVNARWQSPTTGGGGPFPESQLRFTYGVVLDLKLQLHLADQAWLRRIFPRIRGTLNISADNLLGGHLKVHEANGLVPLSYAESYLNPTGRTFRLTLRKRFH